MGDPMQAFQFLCDLISIATPENVKHRLPKLFTVRNLEREPLPRRIGAFMEWRKRGGFELVRIKKSTPLVLEAEIQFPVTTDHWLLHVILDDEGSGRIDELLMGRAPLPDLDTARSEQEIAQEFIDYIQHLGDNDLFSGVALIGKHDTILGTTATGLASREYDTPNTTETLFNLASLTKSWTAVAAAKLIEDGLLKLTSRLKDLVVLKDVEFDERIEIRHLMSHTSGLGDYFGPAFDQTPKDRIRELDDFLGLTSTFVPKFSPGTDWSYSNIGMILLGKVIESVSKEPYHSTVKRLVLDPAGMSTAYFPHLDQVNTGCASGYGNKWTMDGPVTINALHSWAIRGAPDGCAFGSLLDIWSFSRAFRGGILVSNEMATLMTSPKPELGSEDYGYGFTLLPERAVVGHSGGLIGASANLDMINAPDDWTVIVLANDLSMRTPVIKARQLIGVRVQEREDAKTHLPRAGLTAR